MDIESVSGNERELADLVEARLSGLDHLEVFRDGDCVVARTGLGRGERVVIAGHLDTVPLLDNLPSRYVERSRRGLRVGTRRLRHEGRRRRDDRGRDGSGVAAPRRDLDLLRPRGGRGGPQRPRALARQPTPTGWPETSRCSWSPPRPPSRAAARAPSGSNSSPTAPRRTARGPGWATTPSTSSPPRWTPCAAYVSEEIEVEGLVYREGLNAVAVSGGVATNMIPPSAVLTVNYRYAPDKTADEALARLAAWFPGYELAVTDVSPAARPGLDRPARAGVRRRRRG